MAVRATKENSAITRASTESPAAQNGRAEIVGVEERNEEVSGPIEKEPSHSDEVSDEPENKDVLKDRVVIIAGRPSSGKSRALRNLFGVDDFLSKSSVKNSVTTEINYVKVKKYGHSFIVVDTPGLGAEDIPMTSVEQDFLAAVGDLKYTLVYCHSVGPNSKFIDLDKTILKNLQRVLGKGIWKRCVILFTFSDNLRAADYPRWTDRKYYLVQLKEHADHLEETLKKVCGKGIPNIKLVTDENVRQDDIVAVPVGLFLAEGIEEKVLIPAAGNSAVNWVDKALSEIIKKSQPLDRIELERIAIKAKTAAGMAVGVVVGAALGGMAGAVIGAALAGVGAIPLGVTGAITGGAAGGISTGSIGRIILSPYEKATGKKKKTDKLVSAKCGKPLEPAVQDSNTSRRGYSSTVFTASSGQAEFTRSSPDFLNKRIAEEPQPYTTIEAASPSPRSDSPPDIPSECPDNDY